MEKAMIERKYKIRKLDWKNSICEINRFKFIALLDSIGVTLEIRERLGCEWFLTDVINIRNGSMNDIEIRAQEFFEKEISQYLISCN